LRTVLRGIIFPILNVVEGLIVRLLDAAAGAALALLRANRNEFLDALADSVTPSRSATGRAESAASSTTAIQQMGREAILNNRLIVLTFDVVTGGSLASLFQLIAAAAARVLAAISSLVAQALRAIAEAVLAVIQGFFRMAQAAGRFASDLLRELGAGISGLGQYVMSLVGRGGAQLVGFATGGLSRLRGFVTTFVRSLISGGGIRASVREALGEFRLTETFAPGYVISPVFAPAFAGPPIQIIGGLLIILIAGLTIVVPVWVAVLVLVLLLILIIIIIWLIWRWLRRPKPKPKRVISVTPSAAELGVGGRDMNSAATIAPGTPPVPPLVWTINPGATPPAGTSIIGTGQTVVVRAAHPSHGTVVGGMRVVVRAALASDPADFADSTGVMLIQVLTADYTAAPALIAVPSAIPGTPPPNTAEPNRDGITGNTATVNTTTAPAGRPVAVTVRSPLAGTTIAGTTVTPGAATGDVGLRIADTATDARLDETRPPTSGPAARMADLTVNAVATDVRSLAFQGRDAAGPYSARNRINYVESDTLHTPLTRIVGELIGNVADDFNLPAPNGNFNPTNFRLDLAVPANSWVDRLVAGRNVNSLDGRRAFDVNRFIGLGAPGLPRRLVYSQRFRYSAWHGAGTVTSAPFADGQHVKLLRGTPPSSFDFKIEHHFVGVTPSTPPPEPYAGPPLIVLSNIVLTPDAPGATALAADGVATGQLGVALSVAGRTVLWSVLSGDIAITGGNPATPPATATLKAGLRTGNFDVRVADNIYGNRQVDGKVGVVAVALRNMRATPNPVPSGTNSASVSLDANPGGRTVNWSVDPAAAAAGVTVTPATTGPGAPAMSATVTRPAGFTGSVVVTAVDSVLAAQTSRVRIIFR
ncbi:MAG: hypothetical protein QOF61_2486, partial [Acidobacteriota bacterium]|nr:hypothetical protein [Acidobacteriota bacterium]